MRSSSPDRLERGGALAATGLEPVGELGEESVDLGAVITANREREVGVAYALDRVLVHGLPPLVGFGRG